MHTPEQYAAWQRRAYSWSQHSSWQFDKNQWYERYLLGAKFVSTPALEFGKKFADSIEWGQPMAPVLIYPVVEYGVNTKLNKLDLTGYMDSWCPDSLRLAEYKTGVKKWDQKRVNAHGQLTFYALLHYLHDQIRPEDIHMTLQWLPTVTRPDFTFGFPDPAEIHTFTTSRTTLDVLTLANEILSTRKEMEEYIIKRATEARKNNV